MPSRSTPTRIATFTSRRPILRIHEKEAGLWINATHPPSYRTKQDWATSTSPAALPSETLRCTTKLLEKHKRDAQSIPYLGTKPKRLTDNNADRVVSQNCEHLVRCPAINVSGNVATDAHVPSSLKPSLTHPCNRPKWNLTLLCLAHFSQQDLQSTTVICWRLFRCHPVTSPLRLITFHDISTTSRRHVLAANPRDTTRRQTSYFFQAVRLFEPSPLDLLQKPTSQHN